MNDFTISVVLRSVVSVVVRSIATLAGDAIGRFVSFAGRVFGCSVLWQQCRGTAQAYAAQAFAFVARRGTGDAVEMGMKRKPTYLMDYATYLETLRRLGVAWETLNLPLGNAAAVLAYAMAPAWRVFAARYARMR